MLNVSNLNVAYGESRIIRDLSLEVKPTETVAIMGRNGMGKTTLMKSLMGVIKTQSGEVRVDEHEITHADSFKRVKRGMAYVPQGRQIFSSLSVEDNIRTGMETLKDRGRIDSNIFALFPVLYDMRRRKGGNLSGGQQQQLAIARALVSKPKVLLLDEPTEGIQPSIIKEIVGVLNEIKKIHGLAIVVSEQVLSFALDIADRVLVIESGKIVHEDPREAVDEAKVARYLAV